MSIKNGNDKLESIRKLTTGDYKAFLFDCDGTLADNMEDHKETYVRIAEQKGVTIDPGIVDELAGYPTPALVEEINKRYGSKLDPKEFDVLKSDLFEKEFVPQTKPIGFVVDFLKESVGTYKIAVVSGSAKRMIQKTIELLGIAPVIDLLICAEDYEKGKPDPEPFLVAAKKLGVEPKYCIVFEDGDPGVKAAESAGMKSIRVDQL